MSAILQAADGALLDAELVPVLVAALLGTTTLVALAALATQPARRRPYLVTGVLVSALLAAVHAGDVVGAFESVAIGGTSGALVARVATYAVVLGLVLGVTARIGDRPFGTSLALACLAIVHAGALVGWLLLGNSSRLAALGVAVLCLPAIGVLAASALRSRPSRARGLLATRLLAVLGLAWTLALAALGLSPEGVGVFDGYTAAFVGGYLDVAIAAGVTAALAAGGEALDDLVEEDADGAAAGSVDETGEAGVAEGTAAAGDGGTVPDGAAADE